jgi:hypothetical protein
MGVTSRFIPRNVVQSIPSVSPNERVVVLNNGGTINVDYDMLLAIADPNLLGAGVSPSPTANIAVGPYLDALLFADQVITLQVFYAVSGGTFRLMTNTVIPASTPENISGLRITGRYVRVSANNSSGVAANVELGVYPRST